jgi:hypothetical protein
MLSQYFNYNLHAYRPLLTTLYQCKFQGATCPGRKCSSASFSFQHGPADDSQTVRRPENIL